MKINSVAKASLVQRWSTIFVTIAVANVACEAQTYFRSSLLWWYQTSEPCKRLRRFDFLSLFRKMRPAIIGDQIQGKTTYIMRKDQHEDDTEIDHRYFLTDDKSERNMRERVKITNRKTGATCLASPARGNFTRTLVFRSLNFPCGKWGNTWNLNPRHMLHSPILYNGIIRPRVETCISCGFAVFGHYH